MIRAVVAEIVCSFSRGDFAVTSSDGYLDPFLCVDGATKVFPAIEGARKIRVTVSGHSRKGSRRVLCRSTWGFVSVGEEDWCPVFDEFYRWLWETKDSQDRRGGYLLIEPLEEEAPCA